MAAGVRYLKGGVVKEIYEHWDSAPEKVADVAREVLGEGFQVWNSWNPSGFQEIILQKESLVWAFSRPQDLERFLKEEMRKQVKHLDLALFDQVMGWADTHEAFELTLESAFRNCIKYDPALAKRLRAHLEEIGDRRLLEVWKWAEESVAAEAE